LWFFAWSRGHLTLLLSPGFYLFRLSWRAWSQCVSLGKPVRATGPGALGPRRDSHHLRRVLVFAESVV